jgi:hypothetical protein
MATVWSTNGLQCVARPGNGPLYQLRYDTYDRTHELVVKGTPMTKGGTPVHSFEVLSFQQEFFVVRVAQATAPGVAADGGFLIEVSDFGPQ